MNDDNLQGSCGQAQCAYASRVAMLERDSLRNSEQHREFYKGIGDCEKALAVTDNTLQQILSAVSKVESNVAKLTDLPGKRWETLISAFLSGGAGILLGIIFSR